MDNEEKVMLKIKTAVTSETIAAYWEKAVFGKKNSQYRVWMEGQMPQICSKTHFQWKHLNPNREYTIYVEQLSEDGKVLAADSCCACTTARKERLDVTKAPYFAKGDAGSLNTKALQQALDDCTKEQEVYIPAGIFLTGALRLHSNTTIYLEKGAVLQGTDCVADYNPRIPSRFEGYEMECYSSLLNMGWIDHNGGYSCENILIYGEGTISGGGKRLAEAVIASERERLKAQLDAMGSAILAYENENTIPGRVRPRLINISNCQNVRISGLSLENGSCWNVHMIYSRQILTDHCVFRSEGVWNGDGWDPDSSEECTIFACEFFTGDDSIAIKSGKNPEGNKINRPSRQIQIFDCHCGFGHGFTIGSEMSGGVDGVTIWDCDLSNGRYGIEIKGTAKRGGYVRNINVFDCVLPRILFHSVGYNDDGESAGHPPKFENCSFSHIRLLGEYMDKNRNKQPCCAIELEGFEQAGYEIENIAFRDICIPAVESQKIMMKFCSKISFQDISVTNQ